MIGNFYYFVYLLFNTLIIFVLYLLTCINKFNIVLIFLVFIMYIIYSVISVKEEDINNFFIYKKNETYEEEQEKLENFILVVKKVSIFTLIYCLMFFNLLSVILILEVFDFIVKITLNISLIEFYYRREISFE